MLYNYIKKILILFIILLSISISTFAINQTLTSNIYFNPTVSFKIIQNSQNIEENKFNSLNDIYNYLSILENTGKLNKLSVDMKNFFISKVQSMQNSQGGFGSWERDRSKSGSTRMALDTLKLLDAQPSNKTMVIDFLNRLQVLNLTYGNFGFRSSLKDTDADVSSTDNVIYSLKLLNASIPNKAGVIIYLKNHQNFDGGFGLQTNRDIGIIWTSTLSSTRKGIEALDLLGEISVFYNESLNFIKKKQSINGGFSNENGKTPTVFATYNAIYALKILKKEIPNSQGIKTFILNNQEPNGGFKEHALDNKEGIHTTFFAISILKDLNENFDKEKPISYADIYFDAITDGGFGNDPGLGSTIKSSFNAISSLNLIGKKPENKTQVINFLNTFKNLDGGFGEGGISNIETTYRALLSLNLLGQKIDNPSKTIEYIKSLQNPDGGFGFGKGYISRGSYTYRALRALEILGSEPNNKFKTISFLKLLQNPNNGFGNLVGDTNSDLGSTYRTIRALNILGSEPNNVEGVKQFISNSQNLDGGFKRSPIEIVAPDNISKTIFTYDAILSYYYLGDINKHDKTITYLKDLRNPDLGFAPKKDFTTKLSSTFTSLWTYYYLLNDEINFKPKLKFGKVERVINNTQSSSQFSVRFYDNNSQIPEYVHLILNNEKYLMAYENDNLKGEMYTHSINLPIGIYNYYFESTDGINFVKSKIKYFNITAIGNLPKLNLNLNSNEGGENTLFKINVTFDKINFDNIEYVKIKFNDNSWINMNKTISKYIYETKLLSGQYTFKVKAYDGINILSSDKYQLYVYGKDINKPNWKVFRKINSLILNLYNKDIKYNNIEKTIIGGNLLWKVNLGNESIYVNYNGVGFYEIDKKSSNNLYYLLGGGIFIILILIVILVLRKKRIEENE